MSLRNRLFQLDARRVIPAAFVIAVVLTLWIGEIPVDAGSSTTVQQVPEKVQLVGNYRADCHTKQDADLCVQRHLADVADQQLWFTGAGFVLLIFTTAFAGVAAFAAWLTFRTAKQTAERQLRAYINLESAHLMLGEDTMSGQRVVLDIVFRNFGETPARTVRLQALEYFVSQSLPSPLIQHHGTVGPTGKVMIRETFDFTEEMIDRMRLEAPQVTIEGEIRYRTAFGQDALTEFRLYNAQPIFEDLPSKKRSIVGFHMRTANEHNGAT